MSSTATTITVAQTFGSVKSLQGAALSSNRPPGQPTALTSPLQVNSQLPLFSDSMIHHNDQLLPSKIIVSYCSTYKRSPYGVSRSYRVLSPQLLLKKFDYVRDCLEYTLGLTKAQREVTLRLLRLWAYYGQVYPKEAQVTGEPGCSKATYWRTIRLLRSLGLCHVINRYVIRPYAQISNLYRLDRLVVILARYLAEHGTQFLEKWLKPYLSLPGSQFWGQFRIAEVEVRQCPVLPSYG